MEKLPTHGILFRYLDTGVLLVGESGIGKSDLMLDLLYDNAQLVCDDAPSFRLKKTKATTLVEGYCDNSALASTMHIRGIGLICVTALFGKNAVINQTELHLIIQLVKFQASQQVYKRVNLAPEYKKISYQQQQLTQLMLTYDSNRPMALLIKTAIKQFRMGIK